MWLIIVSATRLYPKRAGTVDLYVNHCIPQALTQSKCQKIFMACFGVHECMNAQHCPLCTVMRPHPKESFSNWNYKFWNSPAWGTVIQERARGPGQELVHTAARHFLLPVLTVSKGQEQMELAKDQHLFYFSLASAHPPVVFFQFHHLLLLCLERWESLNHYSDCFRELFEWHFSLFGRCHLSLQWFKPLSQQNDVYNIWF